MKLAETIAVAFSMYSALPVPQFAWDGKNMKYAMCAFPLVGAAVGALVWAAGRLCMVLSLPQLLRGAALCLIPVLVTGGIHLDGYCDTSDALASHASPERMREILEDPHIGAFAAIRLAVYMTASFALCCELSEELFPAAAVSFCVSRCLSGLSVCCFPLAKKTGLAYAFASVADRKRVSQILCLELAVCAAAAVAAGGAAGIAMLALAGLCYWHYYQTAVRKFGGLSGDLAGWFLQRCELGMLAVLCMASFVR